MVKLVVSLALLSLVARPLQQDHSSVRILRLYPDGWHEVYRTSVCTGQFFIALRDTVSGEVMWHRVVWPVPGSCGPGA